MAAERFMLMAMLDYRIFKSTLPVLQVRAPFGFDRPMIEDIGLHAHHSFVLTYCRQSILFWVHQDAKCFLRSNAIESDRKRSPRTKGRYPGVNDDRAWLGVIHTIASVIGGLASQDAVGLITGQITPLSSNNYIYNAIASVGAAYQF